MLPDKLDEPTLEEICYVLESPPARVPYGDVIITPSGLAFGPCETFPRSTLAELRKHFFDTVFERLRSRSSARLRRDNLVIGQRVLRNRPSPKHQYPYDIGKLVDVRGSKAVVMIRGKEVFSGFDELVPLDSLRAENVC